MSCCHRSSSDHDSEHNGYNYKVSGDVTRSLKQLFSAIDSDVNDHVGGRTEENKVAVAVSDADADIAVINVDVAGNNTDMVEYDADADVGL